MVLQFLYTPNYKSTSGTQIVYYTRRIWNTINEVHSTKSPLLTADHFLTLTKLLEHTHLELLITHTSCMESILWIHQWFYRTIFKLKFWNTFFFKWKFMFYSRHSGEYESFYNSNKKKMNSMNHLKTLCLTRRKDAGLIDVGFWCF